MIQSALPLPFLDPGREGLVIHAVVAGERFAAGAALLEGTQQGFAMIPPDLPPPEHIGLQNRGRFRLSLAGYDNQGAVA